MDYVKATFQRKELWEKVYRFFKKYDLLLTPTLAVPAFPIEEGMGPRVIDGKGVSILGWMAFTFPFNLTGQPAASVPCGWTREGLPVGLQIIGRRFDDATVLDAAAAFEEASPWAQKRPSID